MSISAILSSKDISNSLWRTFTEITDKDTNLPEKDIRNKYSSKFLQCKLNTEDEEVLKNLSFYDLGLLLLGNLVCDVDYEIGD